MDNLKNAYAVIIGVGADLPASVKDAQAIYDILSNKEIAGYKKKNITLLVEEKAVRKHILEAFENLIAKTDADSSILLFYSGHGGTYTANDLIQRNTPDAPLLPEADNTSHYFLQPNDLTIDNFQETWVKAEELKALLNSLKSRRIILFLDCCHAEGMTKSGNSLNTSNLKQRLRSPEALVQKIDDGRGISLLTSCRAEELSWILEGDSLSLFTKCLTEVLKGEHKSVFEEPYIRMTEVINYLMRKVPERKPVQRPFVNIQMYDDFILSRIPKGKEIKPNPLVETALPSAKESAKEIVSDFRKRPDAVNAILFVHGFSGESSETFQSMQSLIGEDDDLKGWDMFPLGYAGEVKPQMGKNIWASVEDIDRVADYLASAIQHRFDIYKRIAVVAHGLGGLAVQRALLMLDKKDFEHISYVLLFGTPSNGILDNSKTIKDIRWIELQQEGMFITNLRREWKQTFAEGYPFTFKVIAATDDKHVEVESIFGPFEEENKVVVAGNHFTMTSPDSFDNDSYRILKQTLSDNIFYNQFTNREEINNLLGDFDAVVRELLPNVATLHLKGLKQLLFALEGLDRKEEVMKILLQHPLSQENTNLLGLLGGRLKRKFLHTFSGEDGKKAMEYYAKGLEISSKKEDIEQIYYHAINLAFLSLVYEEDKAMMREYALQALKATEKDPFDSLWKKATIAEAAMYTGDFEKAMAHYTLAAEVAGIREKISIHTNAYIAYCSLMRTEEDNFTKFLKVKFLT